MSLRGQRQTAHIVWITLRHLTERFTSMRTEDEDQLGHLTRGLDAFQDVEPFGADSVN